MTDVYLNVTKNGAKPKSSRFKFNFNGTTYHADTEEQLKQLIEELQNTNKKFMN